MSTTKRFLLLAAFASLSPAATFYVSTQGADSNAGTSAKPWATLQHAVDTIPAGGTILVEAGTYIGCASEIRELPALPKRWRPRPEQPYW